MSGETSVTRVPETVSEALGSAEQVLPLLNAWVETGHLRAIDGAFARFLHEQGGASPVLLLAAALASYQLGRGHVCLDLERLVEDPGVVLGLFRGESESGFLHPLDVASRIDAGSWRSATDDPVFVGRGPGDTPLVRIGDRLYLRRYWRYEEQIRQAIAERLDRQPDLQAALPAPDELRHRLDALFPGAEGAEGTDWQKIACALAARNAFTVVTGGPGTGKTTTVIRLLALLQSIAFAGPEGGRALRIRLAAPTGKAAARLSESITRALASLQLADDGHAEAIRASIPAEAATLHRLLGSRPDTRHFRHDRNNPLSLDVLVVDEASMVDVEMMASVLEALPQEGRIILLGDKDQLASVEAGAVLGELCARAENGHYTPATRAWLEAATGEAIDPRYEDTRGASFDQAVVMLRRSHRFGPASGIGRLAEAVNSNDPRRVEQVWSAAEPYEDIARIEVADERDRRLSDLLVNGGAQAFPGRGAKRSEQGRPVQPPVGYAHYLDILRETRPADGAPDPDWRAWARRVLTAYGNFQVLCAVREGPWGVAGLNERAAEALAAAGLIAPSDVWYEGRPVLITRNDYQTGVMNGDIGIVLRVPEQPGEAGSRPVLRVAFPASDDRESVRWILPSRLHNVETAYALTVHKSQGSEFTHTALVLPDRPNPVITRELIYTGITRARDWFSIVLPEPAVLEAGVASRVDRVGGLRVGMFAGD